MERLLFNYEGRLDKRQFAVLLPLYLVLYTVAVLGIATFGAALASEAMARASGQPLMSSAEIGYDVAIILVLGALAFVFSGGMAARLRDLGRSGALQWLYLVAAALLIGISIKAGLMADEERTLPVTLVEPIGAGLGIVVLLALFFQAALLPLGETGVNPGLIFGGIVVVMAAGLALWFRPELQEFWNTHVMKGAAPLTTSAPATVAAAPPQQERGPMPGEAGGSKAAGTTSPPASEAEDAAEDENPPLPSEPATPPPEQLAAPPPAPACSGSRIEILLCTDSSLVWLNVEVDALYRKARAAAADPGAMKAEQDAWRDSERDACTSAGCLRAALLRRKQELRAWVSD